MVSDTLHEIKEKILIWVVFTLFWGIAFLGLRKKKTLPVLKLYIIVSWQVQESSVHNIRVSIRPSWPFKNTCYYIQQKVILFRINDRGNYVLSIRVGTRLLCPRGNSRLIKMHFKEALLVFLCVKFRNCR